MRCSLRMVAAATALAAVIAAAAGEVVDIGVGGATGSPDGIGGGDSGAVPHFSADDDGVAAVAEKAVDQGDVSPDEVPLVLLYTGHHMPALGLGTWQSTHGEVTNAVFAAVRNGYRHIDTAAMYGNEKEIGSALRTITFGEGGLRREELFITSKLPPTKCHPHLVLPTLQQSLEDLQLEYLDMYLVHWPMFLAEDTPPGFPPPVESRLGYDEDAFLAVWRELEAAVRRGLVINIGVSNMSAEKLEALLRRAEIMPAVNQVEMHLLLQQRELRDFCQRNNVGITAYSPLGSPGRPPRHVRSDDPRVLTVPEVLAIAAMHEATPAQVALAWCLRRGVAVIPKSVKEHRIRENIVAVRVAAQLTEEELQTLDGLDLQDATGRGRLIRGDAFITEGGHWLDLWDEGWWNSEDRAGTAWAAPDVPIDPPSEDAAAEGEDAEL